MNRIQSEEYRIRTYDKNVSLSFFDDKIKNSGYDGLALGY